MTKAAAWTRLVAVAGGYAVALVLYLRAVPGGVTRPGFVFVAMVCVLGLTFVAAPVVPLRVPGALRRIRGWEARGRVYRTLGVPFFGRLLRRTPLRLLNRDVYLQRASEDPARVLALLESAEASHLLSAVLTAPYILYAAVRGEWLAALALGIAQVLVNAYPIAHTRLARHRVERMAALAADRKRRRTYANRSQSGSANPGRSGVERTSSRSADSSAARPN